MLQKEMLFMAAVIFVVEDDKNIREIETFSLKNAGYIIEGFECAKEFY